jgi:hypothetical protein
MKTLTTILSKPQRPAAPDAEQARIDNARLRLVTTIDNGNRKASILKDGAAEEYVVRFYENDKYLGEKTDIFTSSRSDANSQARKWVSQAKGASAEARVTEHAGDTCQFRDLAVGDQFTAVDGSLKGTKLKKQSESLAVNLSTNDVVRVWPDAQVQRAATEHADNPLTKQVRAEELIKCFTLDTATGEIFDHAVNASNLKEALQDIERQMGDDDADLGKLVKDGGNWQLWHNGATSHPVSTVIGWTEDDIKAACNHPEVKKAGIEMPDTATATAADDAISFFVEIRLGNDTLTGDGAGAEIARLLREAADAVEGKDLNGVIGDTGVTSLKDSNGNNVGLFGVKDASLVNNGQ